MSNGLDFDEIHRQVDAGYISVRNHPEYPLRIFNYTEKAQYDSHWTAETLACRGLIVDGSNRIVARPFKKFFSYEQLNGNIPAGSFTAFEKLDGSLGISYHWEGQWHIATRGSFESPQAVKASKMLRTQYARAELDPLFTYLFEIIYPGNRIVVDYGGKRELVLLTVVDTATGVDCGLHDFADIGFPVVERHDGIKDVDTILAMNESNREGFVCLFHCGTRVKFKLAEYKRLHKIVTGTNEKTVWEWLSSGKSLDEMLAGVPDEFHRWVKAVSLSLTVQYQTVEATALSEMQTFPTRKESAEYFKTCSYPPVMFLILDGRDYGPAIWKIVRPRQEILA